MATKKAAVKDLAEMTKAQKSMIHNVEAITERVCAKIGGKITPATRKKIQAAVAEQYLPWLRETVRTHLSVSPARQRGKVTTIVTALTKQFTEATPVMTLVQWKPKAENWEQAKTDPYHLEFCLMNEYVDNPQMKALLFSIGDVAEADKVLESEYRAMLEAIKSEYEQFHSITPATKGSENWSKTQSARLLYGRHLREIVKFERTLPAIAAYVERKAVKKAARKAKA
jgi:hypothetical protein